MSTETDHTYGDVGDFRWCDKHEAVHMVVAASEDFERHVWVAELSCGHTIEFHDPLIRK